MKQDKEQKLLHQEHFQPKQYRIYDQQKRQSLLQITQSKISIISGKNIINIETNCLIGIKDQIIIYKQQQFIQLKLIGYPKRKKIFRSLSRYVELMTIFHIENKQIIKEQIMNTIIQVITKRSPRKFMIYFNPNAGKNSRSHLDKIMDFLQNTNFSFDILTTTHRGHCLQHLKQINPQNYSSVVIVSGDGLVHQFLNSLIDVPVTHVPAGSGNAFAKTQTSIAEQLCQDQQAIFLAIKGKQISFNVTRYQLQNNQQPIYSFLSLEWANLADIDMNSQFLRCIGGLRFDVYGAWTVLRYKTYRGIMYISQTTTDIPPLNVDISNNQNFKKVQTQFIHFLSANIPYISDKYMFAPSLKIEEEMMDLQIISGQAGRWQYAKYLLNSNNGGHFDDKKQKPREGYNFQHIKIKSFRLEPLGNDIGVLGIDGERYQSQKIQGSISNIKLRSFV